MSSHQNKQKISLYRGFTLIELLVVIAVIGLLATIVAVSINSARTKARNTSRVSDIKQYTLAFEMAYDQNKEYPDTGSTSWYCLGNYSDDRCWGNGTSISEYSVLNNILDDWISALPANEHIVCGYGNDPSRCYEGYIYRCSSRSGGKCTSVDVRWFMENSNQSCGPGRVIASYNDCTYCRYP